MKKYITHLKNILFGVIAAALILYIIGMKFFPDQLKQFTGIQTFVVLTDSMVPTIPVGSLVVDRTVQEGEDIPVDTIISFRVDRMGENVVFTHYFRKKEMDGTGKERYYTQAEISDQYDGYTTYREDVLGTYLFHIPYVGKFILFLQSPFALLELGIIGIIMFLYYFLCNLLEGKEQAHEALENADKEEPDEDPKPPEA